MPDGLNAIFGVLKDAPLRSTVLNVYAEIKERELITLLAMSLFTGCGQSLALTKRGYTYVE